MSKLNKKLAIKSYQKQHGLHHKKDKKYGQVYWPYLPILLVTVLGMSLGLFISTQNQNSKSNTVSYASLLTSTNQYRIKNGLSQFSYSKTLSTAAQIQANQIAISNSWSPLAASQKPAFSLVNSNNLLSPTENLAYGFKTSGSIVSAWSNSNYQDSNMLSSGSNSVGFGVVSSPSFMNMKNQKIVVAIFADNKSIPGVVASQTPPKSNSFNPTVKSLAVIRLNSIFKYNDIDELYILAALMVFIAIIIFSKHAYLLHKWINKGEDLVIKHPLLDLALVATFIILAGAIQATGYIS